MCISLYSEENSEDFCPNYIQEFGLCSIFQTKITGSCFPFNRCIKGVCTFLSVLKYLLEIKRTPGPYKFFVMKVNYACVAGKEVEGM